MFGLDQPKKQNKPRKTLEALKVHPVIVSPDVKFKYDSNTETAFVEMVLCEYLGEDVELNEELVQSDYYGKFARHRRVVKETLTFIFRDETDLENYMKSWERHKTTLTKMLSSTNGHEESVRIWEDFIKKAREENLLESIEEFALAVKELIEDNIVEKPMYVFTTLSLSTGNNGTHYDTSRITEFDIKLHSITPYTNDGETLCNKGLLYAIKRDKDWTTKIYERDNGIVDHIIPGSFSSKLVKDKRVIIDGNYSLPERYHTIGEEPVYDSKWVAMRYHKELATLSDNEENHSEGTNVDKMPF